MDQSILVLTPEYPPYSWGGLGTYLTQVVPRLVAEGAQVDVVVCPTYAKGIEKLDHGPLAVPALGSIDPGVSAQKQLKAFCALTDSSYSSAYVQDAAMARLAVTLKRLGRCRRIFAAAHLPSYSGFSYFDKPANDAKQQADEALLFRHSEKVVAPSRFAADLLLRVHRLSARDLVVLPLGAPHAYRSEGANTQRPLDICIVGRIAKQKGLGQLCEVVDRTPPALATFTHIGQELIAEDRAALARRPLQMMGQLPHRQVIHRLQRADVLLSTSLHETFGLAVLEGMAAGAVPVGFNCGSLPELVEDRVDGRLVPIGDTGALVDAIAHLAGDRPLLETLRSRAMKKARQFCWERHAQRLVRELSG